MANRMIKTVYTEELKATVVEGENGKTNIIFHEQIADLDVKKAFDDLHAWTLQQLIKDEEQLPLVYAVYKKDEDTFCIETEIFENNVSFKVSEMSEETLVFFNKVGTYCYLSIQ